MNELDELRAANPVDAARLPVPPSVREGWAGHRRRSRRGRRLAALTAGGAALTGALVMLLGHGDGAGRLSLADRAYAAATAPGVLHWVTESEDPSDGDVERQEGWSLGGAQRIVTSDRKLHGSFTVGYELRSDATGSQTANPTSDAVDIGPPAHFVRPEDGFGPSTDPLTEFRRAYRAGELLQRSPDSFDVRPAAEPAAGVISTYVLDPRTGRPLRLVIVSHPAASLPSRPGLPSLPQRVLTTIRFLTYEHLPQTPAGRARLTLRLPAAPASDAAAEFSALRSGAAPTAHQLAEARAALGPLLDGQLDLAAARQTSAGGVLVPGPAHLCLLVGRVGSCLPTQSAARTGIDVLTGTLRHPLRTRALADAIGTVRLTCQGKPARTVQLRGSAVSFPAEACRATPG